MQMSSAALARDELLAERQVRGRLTRERSVAEGLAILKQFVDSPRPAFGGRA